MVGHENRERHSTSTGQTVREEKNDYRQFPWNIHESVWNQKVLKPIINQMTLSFKRSVFFSSTGSWQVLSRRLQLNFSRTWLWFLKYSDSLSQLSGKLQRAKAAYKTKLGGVAIICNIMNCSLSHLHLHIIYIPLSPAASSSVSRHFPSTLLQIYWDVEIFIQTQCKHLQTERSVTLWEEIHSS